MKKIVKNDLLVISSPLKVWAIVIPEATQYYSIDGIYDANKSIVESNTAEIRQSGNIITIEFSEDQTGSVRYSWIEYAPDNYNDSNQVIVNINNSDTCCSGDSQSSLITTSFTNNVEIKVAELSADAVFIDYCIKDSNKNIESGRIVINNGNALSIDAERFVDAGLLPIEYSVNTNNNVINLKITSTSVEGYTIKYKKTIF